MSTLASTLALSAFGAAPAQHHGVRLVDPQGQPFGCVELETVHHVRFRTDATGFAAIHEPGLMEAPVWFTPVGPAVVAPVDWLGIAGFQVVLTSGGQTEIVLERAGPEPACDEGDRQVRRFDHGVPTPAEHHGFEIVDRETGRPVPAVQLTARGQEWWSDNGGRIAFFDLDVMDDNVRFEVFTHGYTHDPGWIELVPTPGGTTRIELDRTNLAERLVRLTGGGAWRDTVLLGLPAPTAEPLLDGQVLGQDTAHAVEWRGGLFWLWGDTSRPSYPLGNFHASGALAEVDPTPEDGVDLDYFVDGAGFSRGIAPTYPEGPVWLGGLVALDDEELWATFVNVRSDFSVLHDGMVRWDEATGVFVERVEFGDEVPVRPSGPAFVYEGPEGTWVMYRNLARVPADPASLADPRTYQAYTPLVPDGSGGFEVATTADGLPDWQWRTGAPPPLLGDPIPGGSSPWESAVEPDTGETPAIHAGTIAWSPWRGRWLHVFTESFGSTSLIGEIWYAEGDTPVGPWSWARKIVSHDDYSFYNPYLHPWFASRGGRRVVFEGTYTGWLGAQPPTPRHDYNQFLYALDLDDPPVAVPVPFYLGPAGPIARHDADQDAPVAFGALDPAFGFAEGTGSPGVDRVAVHWTGPACDPDRRLALDGAGEVAFWADPPGEAGAGRAELVEWTLPDGSLTWSIGEVEGATPGDPVATVWAPTWAPPVPLSLYPLPESAQAGPDQCGVTSPVGLDGGASQLREGITSYTWSAADGAELGQGAQVELELSPGLHAITLTVSGPSGDAVDTVVVEVVEGDPAPTPPDTGDPPTDDAAPDDTGDPKADGGGCACGVAADGSGGGRGSAGGGSVGLALAALLAALGGRRWPRP